MGELSRILAAVESTMKGLMAEQLDGKRRRPCRGDRRPVRVRAASADQLFPTPEEVGRRMIGLAELEGGSRVLEPSAGTGAIARLVPAGVGLVLVELNATLAAGLAARWPEVHARDFLDLQPAELGLFDAVVMNPPFARGAAVRHVMHARGFVRPGGRLVAILGEGAFFRSDWTSQAFQAWLAAAGAETHRLPPGTFAGTGVAARLICATRGTLGWAP